MTVLDDTAQILLDMDLNLTMNQLFAGIEADDAVDPAVTIGAYGSESPITTHDQPSVMNPRPAVELPRVQFAVRSRDFQMAMNLAYEIYNKLWMPGQKTVNGITYINYWPLDMPSALPGGPDQLGRYTISFRARARRKP